MFDDIVHNSEGTQYGWVNEGIWVWLITHKDIEDNSFMFPQEAIDLAHEKDAVSLSLLDTTVGVTHYLPLSELYEKCQKKDGTLRIRLDQMNRSKENLSKQAIDSSSFRNNN